MKKTISYSLFGNSRLYNEGMIENVKLAPIIYPGWNVKIFISESCPALKDLEKMNCELEIMPHFDGINRDDQKWQWQKEHEGMFWRFYEIDKLDVDDCVIFRDCDSRLSERESKVVNHWLTTSYSCHRIAENAAHHNGFFMGGLWGIKGGIIKGIKDNIRWWINHYKTLNHPLIFIDLEYANQILAPILSSRTIGYGFGMQHPLPPLKEGEKFIGEVVNPEWRDKAYKSLWISPEEIEE